MNNTSTLSMVMFLIGALLSLSELIHVDAYKLFLIAGWVFLIISNIIMFINEKRKLDEYTKDLDERAKIILKEKE